MKEANESRSISNSQAFSGFAKRHPMMFNMALAVSLIALCASALFLVSDILSYDSKTSPAELFSAFSLMNPIKSNTEKVSVATPLNNSSIDSRNDNRKNSSLKNASNSVSSRPAITRSENLSSISDSLKSPKRNKHRSSNSGNRVANSSNSSLVKYGENSSHLNQSQSLLNIGKNVSGN